MIHGNSHSTRNRPIYLFHRKEKKSGHSSRPAPNCARRLYYYVRRLPVLGLGSAPGPSQQNDRHHSSTTVTITVMVQRPSLPESSTCLIDERLKRPGRTLTYYLPSLKGSRGLSIIITRFKHEYREPHHAAGNTLSFPFQASTFSPDGLIFGRLVFGLMIPAVLDTMHNSDQRF